MVQPIIKIVINVINQTNSKMRLTYKFRYPKNTQLDLLCLISKKLYNHANFYVRQDYFHLDNYLNYYDLDFILKKTKNYKLLKAQTSQQILKLLSINWKSYFRALKEWYKAPKKFNGRPKSPKYKKYGYNLLIFTNQNSKIASNKIILTMSETFKKTFPYFKNSLEICIPSYKNKKFRNFKQIRILPRKKFYEVEIIHEESIKDSKLDKNLYLSIDFGLNNLITTVENRNRNPIIISGKILKSINQSWNKKRASLYSIKDKQNLVWTSQLDSIDIYRNSLICDYLHKTARFIVGYCLKNKIGNICLGNLKNIKKNIRMGKKNNQNFVNVPIRRLKQYIKYKSELVGIKIFEVDESFTSKCSSLDLEPIKKQVKYVGKRVKRGLFKGTDYILNADVNGSLNILRKVIGDDFIKNLSDRGCWFQPMRIRNLFQTSHEQYLLNSYNIII